VIRKFKTSGVDAGQALAAWLAARLGEPESEAAARVVGGSVYVDGKRERDPARVLAAAQAVTVQPRVDRSGEQPVAWRLVHEDREVLVVDKPAGLAVQATREAGDALDEQVARAYPGATLLHRIDRDTSGLVLFVREDAARARLQAALGAGRIVREYLAVVAGAPPTAAFVCDAAIGPDPRDRRRQAARVPGGQAARTHVAIERRGLSASLLRCRLDTGRTHQIRVHLADAGLPILGDPLYAPADVRAAAPRLALHATHLAWDLQHAFSPLPEDLARLVA
jgi:23S rRNA pseudouridine1911/1915/1917 synthase